MDTLPGELLARLRQAQYPGDDSINPIQGTPPLCHAVVACPELVEPLLEVGADPNLGCEVDARTPLMYAAFLDPEGARPLLARRVFDALLGAGADMDARDRTGYTALGLALDTQNAPLAERLLVAGASADHGFPGHVEEPMLASSAQHMPHLLPFLVRAGRSASEVDTQARGVFHWLAKHQALAKLHPSKAIRMCEWLQRAGAQVDARDVNGNTPLHELGEAHALLGQWLLRRGADCNAANKKGLTPLMLAAVRSPWTTEFFLMHGADPLSKSRNGVDALMAACTFVSSLAEQASVANHQVAGALRRHVSAQDWLCVPAHRTPWLPPLGAIRFPARLSCANAVSGLLASGADPTRVARDGSTALMRAARFQPESIGMLVAAGAKVHARDRSGWTALMCASGSPRADLAVEVLLQAGADPTEAFEKPQVEQAFCENPHALSLLQAAMLGRVGSATRRASPVRL